MPTALPPYHVSGRKYDNEMKKSKKKTEKAITRKENLPAVRQEAADD